MSDIATLGQVERPDLQDVELTSVRMHALAVWRWLYSAFPLPKIGLPTPVVYARPMDAYGELDKMRQSPDSPLEYLNKPGVWPASGRVPLISFNLLNLAYRPIHSFNLGVNRNAGWPSVGSLTNIDQLSNVSEIRYPTAWDYNFQIDVWTYQPDDVARYAEQLHDQLKVTSAGQPSVWIKCVYPGGPQLIKSYISGNLDFPNDSGDDRIQTYRMSFNLVMEGWRHDQTVITTPTLWYMASAAVVGPNDLITFGTKDLRQRPITNDIVNHRLASLPAL